MMWKKEKISCQSIIGWLLSGISILMLIKSVMLCFCNDIWYDELFTVGMIEHSYGELIAFTARDVHPPLYYCITKTFADLCKLINPAADTVIAAKVVSVLPYFIIALYSVTFIRKRFGSFTSGVFLFSVIAMPQLAGYTVEIRMYSWALLFVTATLLHAYGTLTAEKMQRIHGAAMVLYGLAAAYTQYFACVAVVMIYLYVLVGFLLHHKSRVREWFLGVILSILGYSPWLSVLISQMTAVNQDYWILPLTWRSLGGCVKFLMKPSFSNDRLNTVLAVVLFLVYVAVLVAFMIKTRKLYHNGMVLFAIAGIGALAGLVLFGFLVSILVRPIFVYRYMIPAMGCFWLAFAVCLGSLTDSKGLIYGKLIVTALLVVIGLRNYRAFMGEEEYKALLMQDTQEALTSVDAEDIVIYNFDQVQAVTSYYLEDTVDSYLWCDTPEELIQDIIRPYGTIDDVQDVMALAQKGAEEGRNVLFIGSFNSRDEIVDEWRKAGLTVEEQGSYLLERYWFNIYNVSIE